MNKLNICLVSNQRWAGESVERAAFSSLAVFLRDESAMSAAAPRFFITAHPWGCSSPVQESSAAKSLRGVKIPQLLWGGWWWVSGGVEGEQTEELNSARAKHNISSTWSDVRGTLTLSLSLSSWRVRAKHEEFNILNLTEKSKSIKPNVSPGARHGGASPAVVGVTVGLFLQ